MAERRITQDVLILAGSILFALFLAQSGVVHGLIQSGGNVYVASFIAGMFFTSVVTTAPAMVVLGGLALEGNIAVVALVGAMGAVVGDYLIFAFVRDRLSEDIAHLLSRAKLKRAKALFRRPTFKWFLPFVGGLIIASPLPDELGLALLGAAKLPTRKFVLISYTFNAVGIVLIGLVAHSAL